MRGTGRAIRYVGARLAIAWPRYDLIMTHYDLDDGLMISGGSL